MADTSPRLDLPYLQPSQAQKHVTHNEALQRLDAVTQMAVAEFDAATPPTAPNAGDLHALGAAPTGVWAGQPGQLALWDGTAWQFFTPGQGWRAWGLAEAELRVWDGADWQPLDGGMQNLAGIGIGTSWDATNRLAVASDAALFTHAGSGHQLKLNKAASGDTASLLYQSNFTGHAEMGLAGSNDFSIKVSPDGSVWATGLTLAGDGTAALLSGATIGGDLAFHRGNVLGTVSESGGIPTGAAIERGSNANGAYVRFADGTQICTATATLTYGAADYCSYGWTYPAAFVATPVTTGSVDFDQAATNATPSLADFGPLMRLSQANGSVELRQTRVTGGTAFLSGDTLPGTVLMAVGRWF